MIDVAFIDFLPAFESWLASDVPATVRAIDALRTKSTMHEHLTTYQVRCRRPLRQFSAASQSIVQRNASLLIGEARQSPIAGFVEECEGF
jgi:hypothetical protein